MSERFTTPSSISLGGKTFPPSVVTVLVNWNGFRDTIECLESLINCDYSNQYVVVVDNGSTDGSLSEVAAWTTGHAEVPPRTIHLRGAPSRNCDKPIPTLTLSLDDAAKGHGWESRAKVFLVDGKRNLGFAGGVNIGIRFALANRDIEYVWVLNNDTVVAQNCLSKMEERMRELDMPGMCGSRILFYQQPNRVQVLGGGSFSPWTGTSHLLGNGQSDSLAVDVNEVEASLDHLSGASMLVTRSFLEEVGLMDEGYFLYFEELDWVMRGKDRHRLVYADDAIVYHKEGASIGSSHQRSKRSPLSCFYLVHSRLRFTRKFFPWALPSVFLYSALLALRVLAGGGYAQARAMFAALRGMSSKDALGWTPN